VAPSDERRWEQGSLERNQAVWPGPWRGPCLVGHEAHAG